jgi:acid phosphatase
MASAPAATAPTPATPPSTPPPAPPPAPAHINHVVLVVLENHGYNTIFNNPAAPYINSLASKYALATNYFGNAHGSLKDYFMLTTGVPASENGSFIGLYNDDNLVRELIAGQKTWKSYAMGMPTPGFLDDAYPYLKKHNPFAFLADVVNDPAQRNNLVSLTQFNTDLAAGTLPNLSYVLGDMVHDMHDCPGGAAVTCADADKITQGDTWLKMTIDPVISNPSFQKDGLLIVLFDEAEDIDITNGGGHVMAILVGPFVKPGFQSTTLYQHQSTLRLVCDLFKLPKCPGAAATAPQMSEFFTPPSPI